MTRILIVSHAQGARRWQHELMARLRAAGHVVSSRPAPGKAPAEFGLDVILGLESRRFGPSHATLSGALPTVDLGPPDLIIDLTAGVTAPDQPVLTLEFGGRNNFPAGVAEILAAEDRPVLAIRLDGAVVAQARPMLSDRLWLSRACNDLLAGAISLVLQAVARFAAGKITAIPVSQTPAKGRAQFWRRYPFFLGTGLIGAVSKKLRRRPFYWQVAYRIIDGAGVAETAALDGAPFTVLPDDDNRFYADPFVIEVDGRVYLFVEEFPYATGRGVISVAELRDDGMFDAPRVVLREPHHLSYPQVIMQGDEIFMIPESAAAREVVLYRSTRFPDEWARDTVLISDRDINDATLLESGGRFWIFGTERFGFGSASDTMAVFSAPSLRGPWTAHALNPIAIDHSAARPGGSFVRYGDALLLPVQNGSEAYGGGLGLMRLEYLDMDDVRFAPPQPVRPGPAWARKGIHTLNRAGSVEVVDSAG